LKRPNKDQNMPSTFLKLASTALAIVLVASGCATTGSNTNKGFACAGGAVLAILLSKATGSNDKQAIAAGAAGCAAGWLVMNEVDKKRIRDAQAAAMAAGQAQEDSWVDEKSGKKKAVKIQAGDEYASASLVCRKLQTTISVDGTSDNAVEEEWCRKSDGSYAPRSEIDTA
jgi:hypothetical protein